MRSVRLDDKLEARLKQAAELTGKSISEFIREAIRKETDRALSNRLDLRLADVIGSVRSGGKANDDARQTGRAFTRLLLEREEKKRKQRAKPQPPRRRAAP